jgi:thymidylate kinase
LSGREARGVRGRLHIVRDLLPHPRLPRLRRTYVVTFSGLDGSGKTSQARMLRDALRSNGEDAVIVWGGIGTNRSLARIKSPVKRILRALPRIGPLRELIDRVTPKPDGRPSPLAEPGVSIRRHGVWFNTTTRVWMNIVAIANVYSMRKVVLPGFGRRRIVIFDRYALDSAVRLRHWYGDSLATRFVITLLRHTLKPPLRAYFLDVPPQVAYDRKSEWELHDLECRATFYQDQYARQGVRRLDGTRPADELFAEIATDVWSGLL